MELTKEEALSYHRQMWSDMQRDLGDCPTRSERCKYKAHWINEHFSDERHIINDCLLCEYVHGIMKEKFRVGWSYVHCGNYCPIRWICGRCEDSCKNERNWDGMPISELLDLPENESRKEN